MNEKARLSLLLIIDSWNTGISHGDIYQIIIKWIQIYKKKIPSSLLPTIHPRDELKVIVEEFIYGPKYAPLRTYFQIP